MDLQKLSASVVCLCLTIGDLTRGVFTICDILRGVLTRCEITRGDLTRCEITRGDLTKGDQTRDDLTKGDLTRDDLTIAPQAWMKEATVDLQTLSASVVCPNLHFLN